MRGDFFCLDVREAAITQAAIEHVERDLIRDGVPLPLEYARLKGDLAEFVGRVRSRADTTTRPVSAAVPDAGDELLTPEEVAELLGITTDAVRKAFRTGRFALAARKVRGQWQIPRADVLAVLAQDGDE